MCVCIRTHTYILEQQHVPGLIDVRKPGAVGAEGETVLAVRVSEWTLVWESSSQETCCIPG